MITGIAHVNLTVPHGTLDQAAAFYAGTLGFTPVAVPTLQKDTLAWFDITPGGQQVHVSFGPATPHSSRHPCFRVESAAALQQLQTRIWEHFSAPALLAADGGGGGGRPMEADEPGKASSGAKGVEYPTRFFVRDYAGNRLEFSL